MADGAEEGDREAAIAAAASALASNDESRPLLKLEKKDPSSEEGEVFLAIAAWIAWVGTGLAALDRNPNSLYIFPPKHPLRRAAARVVLHVRFKQFIVVVIFLNCICLALYDPSINHNDGLNAMLGSINIAVTAIFILEMSLQVISRCFIFAPDGAYLRNGWNILDFISAIASIVSVIPSVNQSSLVRSLSALRPIRVRGVGGWAGVGGRGFK